MQKKRCTALFGWMGDASAFMRPVKIFPSVETILKWTQRGGAYKRLQSLQTIRRFILGSARALACSLRRPRRQAAHRKTVLAISNFPSDWRRRQSQHARARALPRITRLPRLIAISFCVLSAMAISAGAQETESALAQIRSVLQAQQDAWNRGDVDGFMNGYARSASTVFISEDTIRRGWQTVRDRYRKKYSSRATMGTLTFSDLEITLLSSDSAVAYGRWNLKRANDQPHGKFTLILKRLPEGWRIVHDHTSAAPPH